MHGSMNVKYTTPSFILIIETAVSTATSAIFYLRTLMIQNTMIFRVSVANCVTGDRVWRFSFLRLWIWWET